MPKETIIKISKSIIKDQTQQNEDESQQLEISIQTPTIEQSQELYLEPIDIVEPVNQSFGNIGYSGWKESDILREIRLDSFSRFGAD
ncbi:hypothetical protein [Brasilonema sp. UFV-L1]|uniref:hypothetical protein n=1 Tax=Brasilonema sp. UFV-L1 TaxID=2234130 RepID=UPI00145D7DAB|nr:hypothetical protein [Brasilonema sp. UFV-L1]NMG08778.1 hypothetical protein [Brasilonema sp. UFV-L1]